MWFILTNGALRTMHPFRFDRPPQPVRQLSECIASSDTDVLDKYFALTPPMYTFRRVTKFVTCHFNPWLKRTDGIRSSEQTGIGRNFLLSKQIPEIKVPRGCRGHVRLKYVVWDSLLVMEQHAVAQF
jgi:hypothetical protein